MGLPPYGEFMTLDPPSTPKIFRRWNFDAKARCTLLAIGFVVPVIVSIVLYLPRFQDDAAFLEERRFGHL